ncbi:MAG: hypothetical protein AAF431_07580 [Pseudomonadota bacterium]
MLNRFFKKQSPRIFLGTLAVVPRSDFKSRAEQWTIFSNHQQDLDEGMRQNLKEIFTFPSAEAVSDPKSSDLVIDVMIPDFQGGEFALDELVSLPLAFMWRPRVKIASRLYYLKSQKTKKKFMVTQKMGFGEYLGRAFSWRGFFRFKPLFDMEDLDHLTNLACHELLIKVQKVL